MNEDEQEEELIKAEYEANDEDVNLVEDGSLPRNMADGRRWEYPFLLAYSQHGEITEACKLAGIHRSLVWKTAKRCPRFARAFQYAKDRFKESLAVVAIKRARDGWEEPIFWQGEQVGTKRVYDNRLLSECLRAYFSERFSPKETDKGGSTTVNINIDAAIGKVYGPKDAKASMDAPDEAPPLIELPDDETTGLGRVVSENDDTDHFSQPPTN